MTERHDDMAIAGGREAERADDVIWTRDLTRTFDGQDAVKDLTIYVPRGKIFGFIGPSGSGKTTTIRLMTGLDKPSSGEVKVLGLDPARFDTGTREKIGYMPQLFVLYYNLTVWENLNFVASLYGMGLRRGKRLKEVLDFVELTEHRQKLVRDISGGMQRRLSLATTLLHRPDLLFLDEPTAGVDPVLRRKFWDHFRKLQADERTFFVTTQYVSEAAYCDLVGVLADGRLLMVDTPEGLRRTAFKGDIVTMTTPAPLGPELMGRLRRLPFVRSRIQVTAEDSLRLTVEDAGTGIPMLVNWLDEEGVEVQSVERYVPPFDDVFVELVTEASSGG